MNFSLSLTFLAAVACCLNAEVPRSSQAPASEQLVQSNPTYVLGADDQLSIHVTDLDELSDKSVRVDPNGMIELPFAGRLQAAGLTIEQVSRSIAQKLSPYIQNPQITINVLEYRSRPVSILGSVNSPGVQLLSGPKRLIDVISLAGGLKPDAGPKVTITREMRWGVLPLPNARVDITSRFSTADVLLQPLTSGQNPSVNIEIRPNDVVSVPKAFVVYVLGEVKKAGGFTLDAEEDISLVRALSLAQGMTIQAAPKKARILRAGEDRKSKPIEEQVDVTQVLAGKASDPILHPNDILFVPNNISGSAMKRALEAAVQIGTGVVIFR
jgi:polysaccharide export outer membrane protein